MHTETANNSPLSVRKADRLVVGKQVKSQQKARDRSKVRSKKQSPKRAFTNIGETMDSIFVPDSTYYSTNQSYIEQMRTNKASTRGSTNPGTSMTNTFA